MKQTILLLCLFVLSCQQEPKDEKNYETPTEEAVVVYDTDDPPVLNRSGEYYPLFYKQSLTTDNYLLYPAPRKQEAYVKSKIDSVYLEKKGTGSFNLEGISHSAYECIIKYKDGTQDGPYLVSTVTGAQSYGYVPYGDVVVHNSIPGKIVSLIRTNTKQLYKEWRTCADKNKYKYNIYLDTTLVGSEYLYGSTPTGTAFLMPHK